MGARRFPGRNGLSAILFSLYLLINMVSCMVHSTTDRLCPVSIMINNASVVYHGCTIFISCMSATNNVFVHVFHDTQYQCCTSMIHKVTQHLYLFSMNYNIYDILHMDMACLVSMVFMSAYPWYTLFMFGIYYLCLVFFIHNKVYLVDIIHHIYVWNSWYTIIMSFIHDIRWIWSGTHCLIMSDIHDTHGYTRYTCGGQLQNVTITFSSKRCIRWQGLSWKEFLVGVSSTSWYLTVFILHVHLNWNHGLISELPYISTRVLHTKAAAAAHPLEFDNV